MIDSWDFYKISEGIVDDPSNTSQAWVETSYNVHHVTGCESKDELKFLTNANVNKKRQNVGFGVWRNIDTNPVEKDNVWSQFYVENETNGKEADNKEDYANVFVKHDVKSATYDPFVEFDLWHGEQSFVASMVCDYVKSNYEFQGPVDENSPFGKSKARTS